MKLLDRYVVLKALVGSHNYNLANEESDRDYKVFVVPTFTELYKGERYSKSIIGETEDNDIHDIRKLTDLLFKANINFLEVLASDEIIIPEGNEEIEQIFAMKKEIFKMNLPHLYDACKGMHFNKMKLLEKGTEGTQHLVDKYGYDTKQALHAYRVMDFIYEYWLSRFDDFDGALRYEGGDLEIMLIIRHGGLTLEQYKEFANKYFEQVFTPLREYYHNHSPNLELKHQIEDLIMQLIKRKLLEK